VDWDVPGAHNRLNALAAIAAARHAGVPVAQACASLGRFAGVKRRMEVRGVEAGVTVYDDFAHHPTAIETTLAGLRRRVGAAPIIAVLEPRDMTAIVEGLAAAEVFDDTASIIDAVLAAAAPGTHVLVMSNGGFENIHGRLLEALRAETKRNIPSA